MAVVPVPGSTERINQVLEALYRAHGIDVVREADIVRFPARPEMCTNGEAFDMGTVAGQIDVRLEIAAGRVLCESFTGIGDTHDERTNDGLLSFTRCSFHVLLAAFFDLPANDHVEREEWVIDGRRRTVYLGNIATRFGYTQGDDQQPDIRFFQHFQRQLEAQPLSPGTHWVRLYHMHHRGENLSNEVLIDNNQWDALQHAMAAYPWPASEQTYDVRLFLVIRDAE